MSGSTNDCKYIVPSDERAGFLRSGPGRVMGLATGSGPGRAGPGLMPGQAGPGDSVVGPGRAGPERVKIHSSF